MTTKVYEIVIEDIITDIRHGAYYNFTIKPADEDEQSYYAPKRKNGRWGVLAFCFMATISTPKLITRLEGRKDALVIKAEKGFWGC